MVGSLRITQQIRCRVRLVPLAFAHLQECLVASGRQSRAAGGVGKSDSASCLPHIPSGAALLYGLGHPSWASFPAVFSQQPRAWPAVLPLVFVRAARPLPDRPSLALFGIHAEHAKHLADVLDLVRPCSLRLELLSLRHSQ